MALAAKQWDDWAQTVERQVREEVSDTQARPGHKRDGQMATKDPLGAKALGLPCRSVGPGAGDSSPLCSQGREALTLHILSTQL